MNQHDQMREALRKFLVQEMPAGTVIGDPEWWVPRIMKALAAEPAPLVRLTDDSLISIYLTCKAEWKATNKRERERIAVLFGRAIMDAMQERNK